MGHTDRRPLNNTPVTTTLRNRHNNRLGSVYSSLYMFWQARHASINVGANRRDAYSVILFDYAINNAINNDFSNTPDALLNLVLPYSAGGGTDFNMALQATQHCMEAHWSTERCSFFSNTIQVALIVLFYSAPVVIFLSDGECDVSDSIIRDLCRRAVALGCVQLLYILKRL
jgi:hypothetical protein